MSTSINMPRQFSKFYQRVARNPDRASYPRLGEFWAKKAHDDSAQVLECLGRFEFELRGAKVLIEGETLLDCNLRLVRRDYKKNKYWKLYKAWSRYDRALIKQGQTLCLYSQIMGLPHQAPYMTERLADFPDLFEFGVFQPTGEPAEKYQKTSHHFDTVSVTTSPSNDHLTNSFIKCVRWIFGPTRDCWTSRERRCDPRAEVKVERDLGRDTLVEVFDFLTCVLAPVPLAAMLFALQPIRSSKTRIAVLLGFSIIFALMQKGLGNPTRGEIFGTTAAFFAVASVFMSSTSN